MTAGFARAREELAAARLLADHGHATQAVSGAGRAAVGAAEDALLLLGRVVGQDRDVGSAFVRHVVRERGLDPEVGRLLRSLLNRSRQVDVSTEPVPSAQAPGAIRDAETVLDVVEAWIDRSIRVATERGAGRPRRPARRRR